MTALKAPKPGDPTTVSFAIESAEDGGYALKRIAVTLEPDGNIKTIEMHTVAYRTELHEINELMARKMTQTFGESPYPPQQQPALTYQQPRGPVAQHRPEPQPFMPGGHDYPEHPAAPMDDRPAILDQWSDKNGPQPPSALKNLKDRLTNGVNQRASAIAVFCLLASYSLAQRPII